VIARTHEDVRPIEAWHRAALDQTQLQRELLEASQRSKGLGLLVDLALKRGRQRAVDGMDLELQIRMHPILPFRMGATAAGRCHAPARRSPRFLEIGSAGLLAFGSVGSPHLPGEVILASGCLSTCGGRPR
jgi:hypothetical protein